MVPAECQNCSDTNDSVNLAVLFGVLGGMAFTAVFVFICVPLVRRRARRHGATANDVEKQGGAAPRRQSSWMSHISRWRRAGAPSAYSAVTAEDGDDDLHRYQEKSYVGGQGGKEKARGDDTALRAVSTFTWSDLRSNHTSAGSALGRRDGEREGAADGRSLATDAATLSHNTSRRTRETASSRGDRHPRPGLGAASASLHHTASPQQSAGISTQAPRDPQTERTGSSKASPARRDAYPDYVRPGCILPTTSHTTLPDDGSSLPSLLSLPSAAFLDHPGSDMDPHKAYDHPHTKSSVSRPGSLQLPSPPASPPQSPPLPTTSSSSHGAPRSHSHVHASSHARTLSVSGARPPLSSTRSAASAHGSTLPFRPPPPPTYTSTPAWWSTTVVHHPSTLSPPQSPPHSRSPSAAAHGSHSMHPVPSTSKSLAPVSSSSQPPPQPPLTHAPPQRSASQATPATENDPGPDTAPSRAGLDRYPSLTVSPAPVREQPSAAPSRSRSMSVSADRHASVIGERPSRTPQGARPQPGLGDTLPRSGSVLSPSTPPTPATAGYDTPREQSDREKERKAYLRASMSIPQTPKLVDEKASRREKGQSVALGYFDPRPAHSHSHGASPAGPPSAAAPAHPSSSSSPRRHSSAAHAAPPPPNLVRRRDSPALRPLPASTLFYPASPPTSPSARPHDPALAHAASLRRADVYGAARSRAGSVTSLATLPEFPAEGRHEGLRRRESVSSRRSMLPAMDRLPPMEFAEFEDDGR